MELVHRMAIGDETALTGLYTAHNRRLYAFDFRITGDSDQAAEVLLESLIAASQIAPTYRGEGRVLTWLLGIVHHKVLNAIRKKGITLFEFERIDRNANGDDSSVSVANRHERRRILEEGLDFFSPEHHSLLDLVFFMATRPS